MLYLLQQDFALLPAGRALQQRLNFGPGRSSFHVVEVHDVVDFVAKYAILLLLARFESFVVGIVVTRVQLVLLLTKANVLPHGDIFCDCRLHHRFL